MCSEFLALSVHRSRQDPQGRDGAAQNEGYFLRMGERGLLSESINRPPDDLRVQLDKRSHKGEARAPRALSLRVGAACHRV